MKPFIRTAMVVAALALWSAVAPAQGLRWDMTTSVDGGKPMLTEFSYMPKKYRIVPEEGQATILRLDTERMILVDYRDKSYTEMTFAEMEEMMAGVDRQMKEMRKQMEALPEDQRKMVEKMMGGHGVHGSEPKMEAVATGEKETINGFPCSRYVLKVNGKEDAVVWATKDVRIPEGIWKQMGKDMEVFAKKMSAVAPKGKTTLVERARTLVDGFPIRTQRGKEFVTTVSTIEEANVPSSEFEVPAGFRKEMTPVVGGGGDGE